MNSSEHSFKAIFCTGMLSTVPQLFRWLCLLCTVENVSFKKTTLLTRSKILEKCFRAQNDGAPSQSNIVFFLAGVRATLRVQVYSLIEDLCDWQRGCQTSDVTPHLFLKLVQFPLTHKTTVPSTNKQIDAVDRWTDTYMYQGRHQDGAPGITAGEDYSRDIISLKSWA